MEASRAAVQRGSRRRRLAPVVSSKAVVDGAALGANRASATSVEGKGVVPGQPRVRVSQSLSGWARRRAMPTCHTDGGNTPGIVMRVSS